MSARNTVDTLEAVYTGAPSARNTVDTLETVYLGTPNARNTVETLEVLYVVGTPPGNGRKWMGCA